MSASTISFYTTSSSALGARLDSSPQTFSRSPNMRRLHGGGVYLPASGVNRPAGASFGTWFAPPPSSVGSYGVTPGERAIMQEADQQYAQRMQGAEMIASKSFSDLSSSAASEWRPTTSQQYHRPMSTAALSQQQLRTFTHSKMVSAEDRLDSRPSFLSSAEPVRDASQARVRFWRLRDADGTSRVVDLGRSEALPMINPAVPTLLRHPRKNSFVREPMSVTQADFSLKAVCAA